MSYVFLILDIINAEGAQSRKRMLLKCLLREGLSSSDLILAPIVESKITDSASVYKSTRHCHWARWKKQGEESEPEEQVICAVTFGVTALTQESKRKTVTNIASISFGYQVFSSSGKAKQFPDLPEYCITSGGPVRCPALLSSPRKRIRRAATGKYFLFPV